MYCKKCGAKLSENAKFCKNCGEPVSGNKLLKEENIVEKIDEKKTEEISSKDNNEEIGETKKVKKRGWFSRLVGFVFKMILVMFIILVLIVAIVLLLDKFKIVDFDKYFENANNSREVILEGNILDDEDYEIETPDADSYFENQAVVIEKIDATQSKKVQNEKNITYDLSERSFNAEDITTHYSMSGEYYDDVSVNGELDEEHPAYQLLYISSNNELWTISIINGSIMATPITYNMQANESKQYIISESEYVTSYDVTTNTFYVTKPNDSVLNVLVVDRIDSDTLDALTTEVISGL